jgi:hypothetical protein
MPSSTPSAGVHVVTSGVFVHHVPGHYLAHIVGLPNWRLGGLQAAILGDAVPPFRSLVASTAREIYGVDSGANNAQARYLCLYLQERGLLTSFYRDFRAARTVDPTGWPTRVRTLRFEG